MNRISALIKGTPRTAPGSLPSSTEGGCSPRCETWKGPLTRWCWHPNLSLPPSRIVHYKFLLVISHPSLWYFVIAAETGLRQSPSNLFKLSVCLTLFLGSYVYEFLLPSSLAAFRILRSKIFLFERLEKTKTQLNRNT